MPVPGLEPESEPEPCDRSGNNQYVIGVAAGISIVYDSAKDDDGSH